MFSTTNRAAVFAQMKEKGMLMSDGVLLTLERLVGGRNGPHFACQALLNEVGHGQVLHEATRTSREEFSKYLYRGDRNCQRFKFVCQQTSNTPCTPQHLSDKHHQYLKQSRPRDNMLALHVDKFLYGEALIVRQIDEEGLRNDLQVLFDPDVFERVHHILRAPRQKTIRFVYEQVHGRLASTLCCDHYDRSQELQKMTEVWVVVRGRIKSTKCRGVETGKS